MQASAMWLIVLAVMLCRGSESAGLAEMISNYARVSSNQEKESNETAVTPTATTSTVETVTANMTSIVLPLNDTSEEDVPEYEDFDDLQENNQVSMRQSPVNANTMLRYFNGLVSLLALMYQFNGRPESVRPNKLHFKVQNQPRQNTLVDEINSLEEPSYRKYSPPAQDRFNPDTATKKFKKLAAAAAAKVVDQQFQPIDTYPPYNPYGSSKAETYKQDVPKTSYDADNDQYQTNSMKQQSNPSPMTDYMQPDNHQNNVDIQPSYSYEVPYEPPKKSKYPKQDISSNEAYQPWNQDDYGAYQAMKPQYPVYEPPPTKQVMTYQPWMSEDYPAHPPKKTKQPMPELPPDDEEKESYQPWQPDYHGHSPKKPKKPNPPPQLPPGPMEDEGDEGEEGDDGNEDQQGRHPWKGKLPNDEPIYHHHFHDKPINYHDFILEEQHPEEEEHHMADEDRESKRPYSYYFLGRKLWYIPLLFSVYFIFYIGALVLKSVAGHKIQFPEKLWELHDSHGSHPTPGHRRHRKINDAAEQYENAIENAKLKYM